jgi:hypothetical protein
MVGLALLGFSSHAINLHALYTASCQREIGIILNVTPRQILLLNLSGEVVPVERFEIISYATYPLDVVPIAKVSNPQAVPLVRILTFQKGELVELIRGWPVDFSRDKIAFLSLKGSERLIERRSIWQVDFQSELKNVEFEQQTFAPYEFVHPFAFSSCQSNVKDPKRVVKVFPQQLLSDPVAIKREMDRLIIGHQEVKDYESDQQFYPVPEVYGNETSLGMWLAAPSRYGASKNRQNNFTPFLVNEFSGGPFGFQSELKTGAGPLLMGLHEEPQTQFYYRMKADYFHFTGMVDPGLLLVGSKYKWFAEDMNDTDIRANDATLIEFGFDWGRFGLEFHLGGATNMGARSEDLFHRETLSVPKFGFRWQAKTWMVNLFGGSGSGDKASIDMLRLNLEFMAKKYRRFVFSLINKTMAFDGLDDATHAPFSVKGESQTAAAYGYWRVKTRYWVGVMAAVENLDITDNGRTAGRKETIPKGGAMVSLSF